MLAPRVALLSSEPFADRGRRSRSQVIDRLDIDGNMPKITQLVRELNIARKLKHPSIVDLHDVVRAPMQCSWHALPTW
eukprot:SAG31_NODE_13456_length_867_cov_27.854167_2_plen_78_part_00